MARDKVSPEHKFRRPDIFSRRSRNYNQDRERPDSNHAEGLNHAMSMDKLAFINRKASNGRNPLTGEQFKIAARHAMKASPFRVARLVWPDGWPVS
jgi:hypothetical protein